MYLEKNNNIYSRKILVILHDTIYRDCLVILKTLIRLIIRLIISGEIKEKIVFIKKSKFKI